MCCPVMTRCAVLESRTIARAMDMKDKINYSPQNIGQHGKLETMKKTATYRALVVVPSGMNKHADAHRN